MPGPFPGMDPYLESRVLYNGIHQGVISIIRRLLNAQLPPEYIADIGERVNLVAPSRNFYPDVNVFRTFASQHAPQPSPMFGSGGGVAVAEAVSADVSDEPFTLEFELTEMREVFVEVRPVSDESRVIAVIEILSYINKTPGEEARERYLSKQKDLLRSDTHLIEIDLLRSGPHTIAAPAGLLRRYVDRWDYLVCLHRAGQDTRFEVWTRTVRNRLPRIRVPLENGLPDVILDLQEAFDRNYEEGAYIRRIDYRKPPSIPLRPPDDAWAEELLRSRGLRPQSVSSQEHLVREQGAEEKTEEGR